MAHDLKLEIIDNVHAKAMVAAARAMKLPNRFARLTQPGAPPTRLRVVTVRDAQEAYMYGGEVMKRWRALIGRA